MLSDWILFIKWLAVSHEFFVLAIFIIGVFLVYLVLKDGENRRRPKVTGIWNVGNQLGRRILLGLRNRIEFFVDCYLSLTHIYLKVISRFHIQIVRFLHFQPADLHELKHVFSMLKLYKIDVHFSSSNYNTA
jgi:hypothetical protein